MNQSQDQKSIKTNQQFSFDSYELGVLRHYGKTLPLCIGVDGEPKYLLGPHYYVFMLTLLITTVIYIFLVIRYYQLVNPTHFVFIILAGIYYIYMYIKIGFSVPGIASSGMEPDPETKLNSKYCFPCKIIKEKGTSHCLFCDVCVYNLDHHCPWIGKCVGRDNMKAFKFFVLSIILLFLALFLGEILSNPPNKIQ